MRHKWVEIVPYEDGRDELYDIRRDVGEQDDRARRQPERVAAMRAALNHWLRDVGATLPVKNPAYSADQATTGLRQLVDVVMPKREAEQARFLSTDFVPGGGWWDDPGRGRKAP